MMRDLTHDRSLVSINSMTVKAWSLEQLVTGCARAGISAQRVHVDLGIGRTGVVASDAEATGEVARDVGADGIGLPCIQQ